MLLLILPAILASIVRANDVPMVSTSSGKLNGFAPRPNVHAWLGIPYAKAPVGNLRFASPAPLNYRERDVVRDSFESSPGNFQVNPQAPLADRAAGYAEDENVLSINIVWLFIRSLGSIDANIFIVETFRCPRWTPLFYQVLHTCMRLTLKGVQARLVINMQPSLSIDTYTYVSIER